MKKISKYIVIFSALIFASSCEDYLDQPPQSVLPVEDIFKDFAHAQGFVEVMYRYVVNYSSNGNQNDGSNFLVGDEVLSANTGMLIYKFDNGIFGDYGVGYFDRPDFPGGIPAWEVAGTTTRPGVWDGWQAIRMANIVLANMDLMTGATQTEKNLIKGQALFFRAFFHQEIMKYWGRIPYVDFVVTGNDDDFKMPRPATFKECAMKADADYAAAAELLPNNWDDLQNDVNAPLLTFKPETFGNNLMRINKAIVYSFKGKNLLFAASPLFKNSTSRTTPDSYDYDEELCEMAAADFARVIQMDRDNVNKLGLATKFNYNRLFYTETSTSAKALWPGTAPNMGGIEGEYIFSSTSASINFVSAHSRAYMPYTAAATPIYPSHSYIHQIFGTANGLACEEDPTYSFQKEFDNRDPRFYKNLIIDGDTTVRNTAANPVFKFAQCYTGGKSRLLNPIFTTGYFIKKWSDVSFNLPAVVGEGIGDMANTNLFNAFRLNMRLTDVYLMYAEALAATTKYGVNKSPDYAHLPSAPSSIDVINMIRARFDVQSVEAAYLSIGIIIKDNPHKYMDVLRRERSNELCFEGHRWDDIRRWVLAHKPEYKTKTALEFERNIPNTTYAARGTFQNKNFTVRTVVNRVCEYPKYFWLPFPTRVTQMYEGFEQNPGW